MPERESFEEATGCAACQSSLREARDVSDELLCPSTLSIRPPGPRAPLRKGAQQHGQSRILPGPKGNSYVYWAALATAAGLHSVRSLARRARCRDVEPPPARGGACRRHRNLRGLELTSRAVSLDAQPASAPRACERLSRFTGTFVPLCGASTHSHRETYQICHRRRYARERGHLRRPTGRKRWLNGEPLPGFEGP